MKQDDLIKINNEWNEESKHPEAKKELWLAVENINSGNKLVTQGSFSIPFNGSTPFYGFSLEDPYEYSGKKGVSIPLGGNYKGFNSFDGGWRVKGWRYLVAPDYHF